MLKTRLIMGSVLIALAVGMLVFDQYLPGYPFLAIVSALLAGLGTVELVRLLSAETRPRLGLCLPGVLLLLALNWLPLISVAYPTFKYRDAAVWLTYGFTAFALLTILTEMATYREPGRSIPRIALTLFVAVYLAILPSFLIQLRIDPQLIRRPASADGERLASLALALAIFVPKSCDIGAYFTGRAIGRHKMTPVLSPKKTWEGAAGGLVLAVAVATGINQIGPVIPGGWPGVILFGVLVGTAGILGDLAESLIKRDCQQKDASQIVPGFGGVLDVIDAILFAGPVVYWWLRF